MAGFFVFAMIKKNLTSVALSLTKGGQIKLTLCMLRQAQHDRGWTLVFADCVATVIHVEWGVIFGTFC